MVSAVIIIIGLGAIVLGLTQFGGIQSNFATSKTKTIVETTKPTSIRNQLIDFQIKKTSKGLIQDEFAQLDKLTKANPKVVKNLKAEVGKPPKTFVTPKLLEGFGIKASVGDKPENLQREFLARLTTQRL